MRDLAVIMDAKLNFREDVEIDYLKIEESFEIIYVLL